jgi:hypothetical protein
MAVKTWHVIKVQHCDHAGCEVGMEAQVVFPPEWLPESAPRVLAHRCSHGVECNLDERPSCVWSGTNPAFDTYLK